MFLTFFPPVPSTTFPVLASITLACNHPPNALSSTLPSPPQMVMTNTQASFSCQPQLPSPFNSDLESNRSPLTDDRVSQKGSRSTEVRAIANAPRNPAKVPTRLTPPFVPGGTSRKFQDVRRRGLPFERIPNSDEKVSAATAA